MFGMSEGMNMYTRADDPIEVLDWAVGRPISRFDEVRPRIAAALEDALRDGTTDTFELQRVMRRAIGRWVSDTHRRRPMIIPVVVEV